MTEVFIYKANYTLVYIVIIEHDTSGFLVLPLFIYEIKSKQILVKQTTKYYMKNYSEKL